MAAGSYFDCTVEMIMLSRVIVRGSVLENGSTDVTLQLNARGSAFDSLFINRRKRDGHEGDLDMGRAVEHGSSATHSRVSLAATIAAIIAFLLSPPFRCRAWLLLSDDFLPLTSKCVHWVVSRVSSPADAET